MKRKTLVGIMIFVSVMFVLCLVLAGTKARWPEQGKNVVRDSKLKVDISNIKEGYFMACTTTKTTKKLKLRVVKGDQTLTYDLNGNGKMEVFPLQLGNGKYKVSLYENTSGKSYSSAGTANLNVKLTNENSPFLYPNQYVYYTKKSPVVEKADELCNGKNEKQAFDAIANYMKTTFVYDFIKASKIKAGVMPDIEGCMTKRMGICQDLSAIMVAMLRSQGIPAKLMIGYADKNYHAWVIAIIDGKEVFYDPTAQLGALSKTKNYKVERFY